MYSLGYVHYNLSVLPQGSMNTRGLRYWETPRYLGDSIGVGVMRRRCVVMLIGPGWKVIV